MPYGLAVPEYLIKSMSLNGNLRDVSTDVDQKQCWSVWQYSKPVIFAEWAIKMKNYKRHLHNVFKELGHDIS